MMHREGYAENYLGIDWGASAIGLAIAHSETRIAVSYATEHNDSGFLDRLSHVIRSENIGTVVMGIPSHLHHVSVKHPSEKLGRLIAKTLSVRIVYQDEMFTTRLAQQLLIQRGEKAVSQHDDAEAARIILQQWLDHE